MRAAFGQCHDHGLREGSLLTLADPRTSEVRAVRDRVGDIQTRPVNRDQPPSPSHTPDVCSAPIGRATRANSAANGSDPRRAGAWQIADLLGGLYASCQPEAHDSPSVSCASTSS